MLRLQPGWRCCFPLVLLAGLALPTPARAGDEVTISVIAILATDKDKVIEPKIECIAKEVKKLEEAQSLTGFRIGREIRTAITVNCKEKIELVDGQVMHVLITRKPDKDNWVQLKITPPLAGPVTYECICGKFFPILTRYQTDSKQRLILAVRIQPCGKK